jgi:hypothetical protein
MLFADGESHLREQAIKLQFENAAYQLISAAYAAQIPANALRIALDDGTGQETLDFRLRDSVVTVGVITVDAFPL